METDVHVSTLPAIPLPKLEAPTFVKFGPLSRLSPLSRLGQFCHVKDIIDFID